MEIFGYKSSTLNFAICKKLYSNINYKTLCTLNQWIQDFVSSQTSTCSLLHLANNSNDKFTQIFIKIHNERSSNYIHKRYLLIIYTVKKIITLESIIKSYIILTLIYLFDENAVSQNAYITTYFTQVHA